MEMIINAGFYTGPMNFSEHIHPCCEIVYLKKGQIHLKIEDKEYMLKENSVHIISPMERHSVTCLSDEYERYVVFMNPDVLDTVINNPVLIGILKNRPTDFIHVFPVKDREYEMIFKKCVTEYSNYSDCQFTNLMASNLIAELLIMIFREYPSRFTIQPVSSRLYDIQKYIDSNYNKDNKIAEIASMFYISQYYLTHSFKKYIGSSPKQYLMKTRMKHVQQLLLTTDMKVTDIAEEVGFDTINDLSRKYKQIYGISPTDYRKSHPDMIYI